MSQQETTPPQDLAAEESVLGGMLVTSKAIEMVLAEQGLKAEHFYRDRHRLIFAAICRLNDAGEEVDMITVADHLRDRGELEKAGGKDAIAGLAAMVPRPGAAGSYAKIVVRKAEQRHVANTALRLRAAALEGDETGMADARSALDEGVVKHAEILTPEALADMAADIQERGGVKTWPWPLDRLNQLSGGGIRQGQLIVISGATHMGKSAFGHQTLDSTSKAGASSALYLNEMDPEEHLGGILQRHGRVPFDEFIQGKLRGEKLQRMLTSINRGDIRWPMVPVAGWTAREICNHIRLHRWDVAMLDILHNLIYEDERDLSNIVSLFVETAKLADCAIVLIAHLNRNRIMSGVRPRPTRSDLRGSGDIENKADVICFVHRAQDDDTLEPTEEAQIYFDKCRGGKLGGYGGKDESGSVRFPLVFNDARIRFDPVEPDRLQNPDKAFA